jgi:hypothetical protein
VKNAHGNALCRLVLDEIGCLAVVAPPLELKQANLSGRWYTKNTFATDLFYARCETADGRYFYSNVVAPFCTTALVPTTILQTAETLDGGGIGGGGFGAFFTTPPFVAAQPLDTRVHPAMVQRTQWTFDTADPWEDSAGWNALHPGSGDVWYTENPKRTPAVIKRTDRLGNCLEFDGIDDIVEIPKRQMPIGAFSISLDLCPNGQGGREQAIIGHGGWESCPVLRLLPDGRLQGGREMAKVEGGKNNTALATSPVALPNGVWSHIVLTFDERTVRLFVNGKPVNAVTSAPAQWYRILTIYLGGDPGHPFRGQMDNIVISSVAN